MTAVHIDSARLEDLHSIQELLKASDLPSDDVELFLQDFLVARSAGRVIGTAGLEVHGNGALLRSLAVAQASRGLGIGHQLFREVVEYARRRGVRHLGLLTTTAEGFFANVGFRAISREKAPGYVTASREYRELCPSSAVLMIMEMQ